MKRGIVLLGVAILLSTLLHAGPVTLGEESGSGGMSHKQRLVTRTGGFINVPGSGPAIMLLATCKIPLAVYAHFDKVFTTVYNQPFETGSIVSTGDESPFTRSRAERISRKALVVITLYELGEKEPLLAIYPEDRVAVINVSRLKGGSEAEFTSRLIKESWRAIGFSLGIGYAEKEADVMQPIGSSTLELDALDWKDIQPMNYMRAQKVLQKYGVKRGHRTTYRRACEQGWAPAPTNDIQKAVWDAVKAEAATNKPAAK